MLHTVRGHFWHEALGRMLIEDKEFGTFEEAKEFAEGSTYHSFKIFNHNNELVHSGSPTPTNTYA